MARLEDEIKQSKFHSESEKLLVNIIFTHNYLQAKFELMFKKFGITAQQYNILRILKGQYPKNISLIDIKNRMLDKNSDVSRIIERMRKKNLVTRKICPTNRRAVEISITQKGLDLLSQINPHLLKHHQIVEHLSKEEIKTLNDLLDKIRTLPQNK